MNLASVLKVIRTRGPLTRAEVKAYTDLSRPTVNEVLAELFDRQLIADEEHVDPDGPRPGPRPRLVRFRAEAGCVLGIDVGASKTLVKVGDLAGRVLAEARHKTEAGGVDRLYGTIEAAAEQALERAGMRLDQVRGAVLSTPGVVDPRTGTVTLAPQLDDWAGQAPGDRLTTTFGCPVELENEMRLAVLGEQWQGVATEASTVVYLGLGVGVGAGILLNGHLHRGFHGTAGEIGYLPIPEPSGQPMRLGLGPFELATGAARLIEQGRRGASSGLLRELAGDGEPDERTVFAAAAQGDPEALAIVADHAAALARGIASVALVVDPELVVIGGGLSAGADVFLPTLRERVADLLPFEAPPIVPSSLADRAAVVGALRRAVELAGDRLLENGAAA
ncbi:ROK family protein [Jiangella alba]|nr:ROK family protein [Jiangella alba]